MHWILNLPKLTNTKKPLLTRPLKLSCCWSASSTLVKNVKLNSVTSFWSPMGIGFAGGKYYCLSSKIILIPKSSTRQFNTGKGSRYFLWLLTIWANSICRFFTNWIEAWCLSLLQKPIKEAFYVQPKLFLILILRTRTKLLYCNSSSRKENEYLFAALISSSVNLIFVSNSVIAFTNL